MASQGLKFSVEQWHDFLSEWSADVLPLLDFDDEERHSDLSLSVLETGTLLSEPATPAVIATAEKRLGITLPESYKRFLAASNGFAIMALDVDDAQLWSTDTIGWLRVNEPDLVKAWGDHAYPVSDADYFNYGPGQDCVHIRTEYLRSCLQISDYIESAVVLLNPEIITESGEW